MGNASKFAGINVHENHDPSNRRRRLMTANTFKFPFSVLSLLVSSYSCSINIRKLLLEKLFFRPD